MANLLCGSQWKDLRLHAWQHLGPATMYKAGSKLLIIKAWFRWRNTRTAMGYINCLHPGRIGHPFKARGEGLPKEDPVHVQSPESLSVASSSGISHASGAQNCVHRMVVVPRIHGFFLRKTDGRRGKRRRSM